MTQPASPVERKFLLWDASAIIPYYVPEAAVSPKARNRVCNLIDAARHHHIDAQFFIPNIVVAEVFVAFDRLCYSSWDPQVFRKFGGTGRALHQSKYRAVRRRFRNDIHNGALFYQYELNRYHILGLDLIAPVDKYRQFYRSGHIRSMGASDLLVGSMAVHLARIHGKANAALITTDRRMEAIFSKACPRLNRNTATKLGLTAAAQELGFGRWGAGVYPPVIDIARCTDARLREWFGEWPLPTNKVRGRVPKA